HHRYPHSFPTRRSSDLVPDPVMHMAPVLKAIEKLVVMAHGVDLRLDVTQFINRLHLARNTGADAAELTAHMGIALVSLVFQRGRSEEHTSELQSRENLV